MLHDLVLQTIIAVVISLLGVWSLVGNSLTILAITTQKNMMTKCNFFIMSLAFSDLFSAMVASPLWIYRRFANSLQRNCV